MSYMGTKAIEELNNNEMNCSNCRHLIDCCYNDCMYKYGSNWEPKNKP